MPVSPQTEQPQSTYRSERSSSLPENSTISHLSQANSSLLELESTKKRKASSSPDQPAVPIIKRSHSSGSSTVTVPSSNDMSSRHSDKKHSSSSSKHSSKHTSSKSSSKHSSSSSRDSDRNQDDWSEVVEPDERRRIQNRIAQRKFREKARETRESAALADNNARAASYSYATPSASDFNYEEDGEADGLPWGSLSLKRVVQRGSERTQSESQRGSGSVSYTSRGGDLATGYYAAPSQYTAGGASAYTSAGSGGYSYANGGGRSPAQRSPESGRDGSYAGSWAGSGDVEYDDQAYDYEYEDERGYGYAGRGQSLGQSRGR